MKEISICVVTLDSKEKVLDCLASLFANTRADFDVVVVDNASSDGTVEAIRSQFPNVDWIVNSENVGFSRAVNQGLKTRQARYYVLINPDSLVEDKALDRLVEFMDANPQAGLCSPRVLNRDGSLQYQCRRGEARPWEVFAYFSGLARIFPHDPRFTGYLLTHLDNDQVNEVKAISGSCMMIRSQVVEQIGYLDERYFAYQEDADFCFAARKAGWKIFYVPDARVLHYGGEGGSRKRPYFAIYQWHRSYYLYYKKNLARDDPFWFQPLYYFAMSLKLMLSLLIAFLSPQKIVGTKKP